MNIQIGSDVEVGESKNLLSNMENVEKLTLPSGRYLNMFDGIPFSKIHKSVAYVFHT